jgi:predicted metal-dependent enzyme (double-stranded beta helix superfamily)
MTIKLSGPYLLCPEPVLEFAATVEAIMDEHEEAQIPEQVAEALRGLLADPVFSISDVVSLGGREVSGNDSLRRHLLYRDPWERFSVQAIVWEAGQSSPIHDHLAWCVAGVQSGEQLETVYDVKSMRGGRVLTPISRRRKRPGDVMYFADTRNKAHQVENSGDETAVSIHVYGIDLQKVGTSVRQSYSLDFVSS